MIPIGLNRPLYGDAPKEKLKRPSFRVISVFCSGGTLDWYRPIYAGDHLFSFGGTESGVEKESEFAERSVFVTYVSVKMNQRAEIVAISRTLAIHTERKTAREKGKYSSIEPATYTDDDIAKLDEIYAYEHVQGAEKRWREDGNVGDVIPQMPQGPLNENTINLFTAGGLGVVT